MQFFTIYNLVNTRSCFFYVSYYVFVSSSFKVLRARLLPSFFTESKLTFGLANLAEMKAIYW